MPQQKSILDDRDKLDYVNQPKVTIENLEAMYRVQKVLLIIQQISNRPAHTHIHGDLDYRSRQQELK